MKEKLKRNLRLWDFVIYFLIDWEWMKEKLKRSWRRWVMMLKMMSYDVEVEHGWNFAYFLVYFNLI